MKRISATLLFVALVATLGFSQARTPIAASDYGQWALASTSAVTAASGQVMTFTPSSCSIVANNGVAFAPLATTAPVTVVDGANTETLTPSAASNSACSLTGTFSYAHAAGTQVISGTAGLQEAINSITTGVVEITQSFSGNAGTLLASATGSSSIGVLDKRTLPYPVYTYNGSHYSLNAQTGYSQVTANGAGLSYGSNSELLTLSTSGQTTDTAANLLPAKSIIDAVLARVTTTITAACTGWELGDATTAARFTANDTTLTAGELGYGIVDATTGIASATTGVWQSAAAKVRVTCAGGNPGAGAIRITVFYHTLTPPTS